MAAAVASGTDFKLTPEQEAAAAALLADLQVTFRPCVPSPACSPQPQHQRFGMQQTDLPAHLQALNAAERDAYADIVADYGAIYAEDREHQVHNIDHSLDGGLRSFSNTQSMPSCHTPRTRLLENVATSTDTTTQVWAAQLDKEAGELREENASLHEQVDALRSSAASAHQVDQQLFAFVLTP